MSRTLNVLLRLNTSDFDKNFIKAQRRIATFGDNLQSLGQSLSAKLTLPLGLLGAGAIKAAGDMEQLRLSLNAITGNAEDAKKELEKLRKLALEPGISIEQAIKGSINLQSVGFSADEARFALLQFSKAVTLAGGGADDLEEIVRQFSQIIGKNKILTEDIKVILSRVPALRIAFQDAFGTQNIEAIRESGIGVKEFTDRIVQAISQNKKFQDVQGGVNNALNNFNQSIKFSLAAIGDSIIEATGFNKRLESLSTTITNAAEGFKALNPGVRNFIVIAAGIAAAVGPASFAIGSLIKLLPTLRIGLAALTGPVGLGVAGLTAVALFISQLDFSKLKTSLDFRASVGSASGIASSPNIDIKNPFGKTQDINRGQSALSFAGLQNTGIFGPLKSGFAGGKATKQAAGGDFAAEIAKNIQAASDTVQRAARPLIEIPKLTGSAFGELAEQVDFSNIALLKSTTATDAAAASIEQVRASTAAWQEQVAAGIPLQIEAAVALEAQNERLEQQRQRFQNIADTIGGTVQDAFSGFFDTLLNGGKNAFKAFGEAIKALIKRLLTAVATALALSLIFSAITGGSGGALSLLGGSGSGFGALFKTLLKGGLGFAQGGLVTGPVSALIGEGPGTTRANPEVVAPLDRLQQLLNNTQQAFVAEARISGDDLLFLVTNAQKKQGR